MAKRTARVKATRMWAYAADDEEFYHAVRPDREMLEVHNVARDAIHSVTVLDSRDYRDLLRDAKAWRDLQRDIKRTDAKKAFWASKKRRAKP